MKKAYNDYVRNNTRYTDFSEGKESSPPVSQYDEDGVRVMPPYAESEIGDIEVKESRYNTISLLQQFCMGITKIVEFFKEPAPSPSQPTSPSLLAHSAMNTPQNPLQTTSPSLLAHSAMNTPQNPLQTTSPSLLAHSAGNTPQQNAQPEPPRPSIPFPTDFIILVYRYLISLFDCSELFTVVENRSKEQVGAADVFEG